MTTTVPTIIADAHYLVREGIKSVVAESQQLDVRGEAPSSGELISLIEQHRPKLVIMDYDQPNAFRPEDVKAIKDHYPGVEVLVISGNTQKQDVLKVLEYGAKGFLMKECDRSEINGAIQAVSKGEKYFCGRVIDIILERQNESNANAADCEPTILTGREIEVVQLMAKGMQAQEIAESLSLSVHTVYTHRKNIMRKLRVTTATEVVIYALRTNLISETEANSKIS